VAAWPGQLDSIAPPSEPVRPTSEFVIAMPVHRTRYPGDHVEVRLTIRRGPLHGQGAVFYSAIWCWRCWIE